MDNHITLDKLVIEQEIMGIVKKYGKLPEDLRFNPNIFDLNKALGVNKTAKLLYDVKKDKRLILDKTISAPFQEIRRFGKSNEKSGIGSGKYWYNKLIYGDNLQALKYLLDNGYKEKIKLIYIDPPFATKSDFRKGEVKVYRDKLEGAEFIEFMRERLILLKELLTPDGSIFIHLDDKKCHYIKIIADEIFTEANFRNELIWHFDYGARPKNEYGHKHNNIFWYSKSKEYIFQMEQILVPYESKMTEWRYTKGGQKGKPMPKGKIPSDVWNIKVNAMSKEHLIEYPTRKPEELLTKIIKTACKYSDDIVLDAFVGSGTTCYIAEKLGHKWIGIDAGKLAIYTSQKRILDIKNHKPFVVMNSGVYEIKDINKQVKIDKELYREFACDLFQVDKSKKETINGIEFDGKYGNNFVFVFDSEGKIFKQDLEELEERLNGRLKRVYVIFSQNQDKIYTNYIKIKNTDFYLHKIPHSLIVQFAIENADRSEILNHLRQNYILKVNRGNLRNKDNEKAPEIDQEALKKINKISQPKKKSEIETKFSNIAGFDFVNTFEIEIEESIKKNKESLEIEIKKVKIGEKTGIENLTMILTDKNYDGKIFRLTDIFFGEDDIEEDEEGNEIKISGFIKTKKISIKKQNIGKEIAIIYFDDFGNELMKQFEIK